MPIESFVYPFDNQTQVTIPGAVHQLETAHITYRAFDNNEPPQEIFGVPLIGSCPYDFTLTFVRPHSGHIILTAYVA